MSKSNNLCLLVANKYRISIYASKIKAIISFSRKMEKHNLAIEMLWIWFVKNEHYKFLWKPNYKIAEFALNWDLCVHTFKKQINSS